MELLIIFLILLILSIKFPESKYVTIGILIYMFVVYSLVYFEGDIQSYEEAYSGEKDALFEVGYTFIMHIAQKTGISFRIFRCFFGLIYILFTAVVVNKCTLYKNIVLVSLSIFPLTVFASIMRQGIAYVIISLGFHVLFNTKKKYSILMYVFCVMIASTIHYSSIVFLLFILCRIDYKKWHFLIITSCSIAVFLVLQNHKLVQILLEPIYEIIGKSSIYRYATGQVDMPNLTGKISIIVIYLAMLCVTKLAYEWTKKNSNGVESNELIFSRYTYIINVYMMLLVPLMLNSMVFIRYLYMLSTINVISIVNAIYIDKENKLIRYLGIAGLLLMSAGLYIYFMLPYHEQGAVFFDYLLNTTYVWEM